MIRRFHPRLEERFVEQILAIDRAWFGDTPGSNVAFALSNPHTYLIHTVDDVVTGYNLIVPVTRTQYDALRQGYMSEAELFGLKKAVSPESADGYYLASVASAPGVGSFFSSRIAGATAGQVLRAQRPVLAVAVTPIGSKIAQEFGMTAFSYKGPITCGVFAPQGFELRNN